MNRIHKLIIVTSLMLLIGCAALGIHTVKLTNTRTGEVLFSVEVPTEIEDFSLCPVVGVSPVGEPDNPMHVIVLFACKSSSYGFVVTNDEDETVTGIIKHDKLAGKTSYFAVVDDKARMVSKKEFMLLMLPKLETKEM